MKNTTINTAIYDLLKLDESQLNEPEIEIILQEIGSLEKFRELRETEATLSANLNDMPFEVSPSVLISLKNEIAMKNKNRNVFKFPVPLYQAVAASIAFFIISFFLFKTPNNIQYVIKEKPVLIEKIIRDTITIFEKIPFQNQSISFKQNKIQQNKSDKRKVNKVETSDQTLANEFVGLQNMNLISVQKKGVKFVEDSILLAFKFKVLN